MRLLDSTFSFALPSMIWESAFVWLCCYQTRERREKACPLYRVLQPNWPAQRIFSRTWAEFAPCSGNENNVEFKLTDKQKTKGKQSGEIKLSHSHGDGAWVGTTYLSIQSYLLYFLLLLFLLIFDDLNSSPLFILLLHNGPSIPFPPPTQQQQQQQQKTEKTEGRGG